MRHKISGNKTGTLPSYGHRFEEVSVTTPAPSFRGRLWRWTRRICRFTTLIVIGAGIATYFGLPVLARQDWARHRVENALTRSLGGPVSITAMAWSWRDGLILRDLFTVTADRETSIGIESVSLQPRVARLLFGQLRLRAMVEKPQILAHGETPESRMLRLPRFGKRGIRLERLEIRDGTYVNRTSCVSGITAQGAGRLENRILRLELSSLSGSFNGATVEGTGILRLTEDGFTGQIDVNEPPGLRDVLRPAHLTIKKAPLLSDPF
jgi:hypothetical protein